MGERGTGVEAVTRAAYALLGLRTYFTTGPKVRDSVRTEHFTTVQRCVEGTLSAHSLHSLHTHCTRHALAAHSVCTRGTLAAARRKRGRGPSLLHTLTAL